MFTFSAAYEQTLHFVGFTAFADYFYIFFLNSTKMLSKKEKGEKVKYTQHE